MKLCDIIWMEEVHSKYITVEYINLCTPYDINYFPYLVPLK